MSDNVEPEFDCLLNPDTHYRVNLYEDVKTGKYMGYVELVDMMPRIVPKGRTGDVALVQGARVSYGSHNLRSAKADKGLVEYLVEHYHTSPLEMGEVKFICCCPLFVFNQLVRHRTACISGDCELYLDNSKISIKDFYNNFKGQKCKVKMCDENTGEIKTTDITDVWESGVKDVFEVKLDNGFKIKTSKDHLFFTSKGWMRLEDAVGLEKNSEGLWYYEVDNCYMATYCDKIWRSSDSLQEIYDKSDSEQVRKFVGVRDVLYVGKEMTYDIEVNGPYHNFVCNGFIVHNSVNCVSRRYTEIPDDSFFVPDIRVQSKTNHQGSEEVKKVEESVKNMYCDMYNHANNTYKIYKQCCDAGVGKEVARGAMPQNIMTSFVWKMDLHNFLKMCRLRLHHTAQKEIQDLAKAMYSLVKPKFPIACGAFEKFWLNSMNLSEEELDMIRKGKNESGNYPSFTSKRRQSQFEEKLRKLNLID